MFKTLNVALHFAVPSGKFKTKSCWLSMNTVGTTHHDSHLVLTSFISHDISEVFKVTTDNVVGLLVEITVGSVHHVSRGQAIVNPLALFAKGLRNRTGESHHIVTRFFFNLKNAVNVKVRIFANLSHIFLRNFTQLSPSFVSQNFHFQPSTVLVLFTPNVAHFRTCVTF
ncbi:Uncharacterised protein [Chlamydia trachomatis]|nr:Uncharacterised protein [Chlamydia trachomatis]